jgi:hypothetical protein
METSHHTVLRRRGREVTYDVGLRLAVMALRVEAAIILASGRGGLEVRRNCARGHDDCAMWMEVRGEDAKSSSEEGGVVVLKEQHNQGLCWRGVDVGQLRTCLEPATELG